MIDFVRGPLVYKQAHAVIVEVQGIGYQIFVPAKYSFVEGEEILLYTHFVVREDAHALYGFLTMEERDLFRLLLDVSGIGPKAGMAMLSNGDPQQLITAVKLENIKYLTKMPGIGKKTAQRLILDLKDKLKKFDLAPSTQGQAEAQPSTSDEQEVIEALIGLGYAEEEARRAVSIAMQTQEETLSTEELIRLSLQASMKVKEG